MANGKLWTPDEIERLEELYPLSTPKEVARILRRSEACVKAKASRLEIKASNSRRAHWNMEEIQRLENLYPQHSIKETADLMGHSTNWVRNLARRLNLKKRCDYWKPEEIAYLDGKWGKLSLGAIAKRLKRSESAVKHLLDDLIKAPGVVNSITAVENFIEGFRLGAKIGIEVMGKGDGCFVDID